MKRSIETTHNQTQTAGVPKSLQELGLPRELALRFEAAFQNVGATRGNQVVGFTFRAKDGVRHPLRLGYRPLEAANQPMIGNRAA